MALLLIQMCGRLVSITVSLVAVIGYLVVTSGYLVKKMAHNIFSHQYPCNWDTEQSTIFSFQIIDGKLHLFMYKLPKEWFDALTDLDDQGKHNPDPRRLNDSVKNHPTTLCDSLSHMGLQRKLNKCVCSAPVSALTHTS